MTTPLTRVDQDREHLHLLSVFHFILAGLSLVGIPFLALHYFMMIRVFLNDATWRSATNGSPPPDEFFLVLNIFYIVMGVMMVLSAVANALSGWYLRQWKNRMFSLIVSGLNMLAMPIGTALGIFTLVVLCRNSVRRKYDTFAETENV